MKMKTIEKQQTNITNLLELIKENPTLRIVPMVDTDVVASDDFSWWTAEWGNASVEEIYNDDERCYIRSEDEETLVERVADTLEFVDGISDEEAEIKGKQEVDKYNWEKVIAVKIVI
jgi:hypothetical protein